MTTPPPTPATTKTYILGSLRNKIRAAQKSYVRNWNQKEMGTNFRYSLPNLFSFKLLKLMNDNLSYNYNYNLRNPYIQGILQANQIITSRSQGTGIFKNFLESIPMITGADRNWNLSHKVGDKSTWTYRTKTLKMHDFLKIRKYWSKSLSEVQNITTGKPRFKISLINTLKRQERD